LSFDGEIRHWRVAWREGFQGLSAQLSESSPSKLCESWEDGCPSIRFNSQETRAFVIAPGHCLWVVRMPDSEDFDAMLQMSAVATGPARKVVCSLTRFLNRSPAAACLLNRRLHVSSMTVCGVSGPLQWTVKEYDGNSSA